MPEPNSRLLPPLAGETTLVDKPTIKEVLTERAETDARTAVIRAMAEYIQGLSISHEGREMRFLDVKQSWSVPEDPEDLPGAVVYSPEEAQYDARSMSGGTQWLHYGMSRRTIRAPAGLVMPMVIEVWCTDPVERVGLMKMLEDALDPVDWMTGARLKMPHYHGAHATFEKLGSTYIDGQQEGMQRRIGAAIRMTASSAQYVLGPELPEARVRPRVEVDGA